jgi:transcription-repair coupling factor (superfamily II helicase)
MKIIQLIQSSKHIFLNGQDKLKILPQKDREFDKLEQRLDAIRIVLRRLNESAMLNTVQID